MKTLISILILGLSATVFASDRTEESVERTWIKIANLNEAMDQALRVQDQECVETKMRLDSKTRGQGGDPLCVLAVRNQAKLNSKIISILNDLNSY